MTTPKREDYLDVISNLEKRVDRLEKTITAMQSQLGLADTSAPAAPPSGGIFYIQAGVPKFIAAGGTPKTITIT